MSEALEALDRIITDYQSGFDFERSREDHNKDVEFVRKVLTESEWQPIEIAPHGEWVLIVDRFKMGVWMACWNSNGYWDTTINEMRQYGPTHWMPLPEPPTK